ncbi:MAG: endonuclease/exonuclease/phosphatase family protein [Chthoniobacteraceae bacterium]|nr:endonuclease/exonuclease/phosphatase family protein [Chthoniobacteraceae bacterium]
MERFSVEWLSFSLKKRSAFLGGFFLPQLRRSLAVFCLFFGIIPLSSPARTAAKSQEFVVASYNLENYTLRSGERVRQKSIPAREAIADVVAEAHPDILGVCELASPEALADLRERLAERGIAFLDTEFVNGPDPDRHVALLSRFPIVRRDSVEKVPFELNGLPELVRRGILDVTIQVTPNYSLRLVGVHLKSKLPVPEGEALVRRMEAQLVREHVDGILGENPKVQLLVYGDMNETREEAAIHALQGSRGTLKALSELAAQDANGERWTHYRQFTDVYSRIDYFFANKALRSVLVPGGARISQSAQWRKASDHRLISVLLSPDRL